MFKYTILEFKSWQNSKEIALLTQTNMIEQIIK